MSSFDLAVSMPRGHRQTGKAARGLLSSFIVWTGTGLCHCVAAKCKGGRIPGSTEIEGRIHSQCNYFNIILALDRNWRRRRAR